MLVTKTVDGKDEVVWGSGRTNSVGVVVDGEGEPLKTEFLNVPAADGKPMFQDHHRTVSREDQVQIYEELVQNAKGQFTTSFVHRIFHPKDNRLLPFGFIDPKKSPDAFRERFGPSEEVRTFMLATRPEGAAETDEDFKAGSDSVRYEMSIPQGLDLRGLTVKATMYYQAIPPYWLHQRFSTAGDQPGTQRLYYLTSHLDTKGTPIEDWKMRLVSSKASVGSFLNK